MSTKKQLQHYKEQGYLIIENLFTEEECETLNQRAKDVVEGRVKLAEGNGIWMEADAVEFGLISNQGLKKEGASYRMEADTNYLEGELIIQESWYDYLFKIGHRMHQSDPIFKHFACHPNIMDVLEPLIGPDIKCIQSMFIDKPRQIGIGQPYHQDSWYLKTDPETLTALWVACDDADLDNGCLHVIPGSHREPVHPHEKPIDPAQRIYAEVHSARSRREIAVPLKKGSGVFFPGHMLHRSGNNLSERKRRSYVLHYGDAKSKWLNNPNAKNPFLLVRGKEYPGCL